MTNNHITTLLAVLATACFCEAKDTGQPPRLVVGITIDNLSQKKLDAYMPLYSGDGLRCLLTDGLVYDNASFSFAPIDCASALAALHTGSTPSYNGITAEHWFDRTTLRETSCTDDPEYKGIFTDETTSAKNLLTTTLSDELKVETSGRAMIYSIAESREAAVIPGGHNADGVFWVNTHSNRWCSSTYYFKSPPKWLETYNLYSPPLKKNSTISDQITDMALQCLSVASLGKDDATDMLLVSYTARPLSNGSANESEADTYTRLDRSISRLLTKIKSQIGSQNVLFVLTGASSDPMPRQVDSRFRLPGGTLYINRTANLLDMYLAATYGTGRYVEGYSTNQIFLNLKQIDQKRLNFNDVCTLAKTFLRQCAGVRNAYSAENLLSNYTPELSYMRNAYNPAHCGELIIEVSPGWNITNEDTGHTRFYSIASSPTPLIFYGYDIKAGRINTFTSLERLSPTIAKSIRIRAPSASMERSLF